LRLRNGSQIDAQSRRSLSQERHRVSDLVGRRVIVFLLDYSGQVAEDLRVSVESWRMDAATYGKKIVLCSRRERRTGGGRWATGEAWCGRHLDRNCLEIAVRSKRVL
jgi:hypothetical protein